MRYFACAGLLLAWLAPAPGTLSAQQRLGYFFEAAGSGGFGSVNLEFHPLHRLQLRGGAGFILLAPTLPLTASYTIGRGKSSLELGGGATVMFFPAADPGGSLAQQLAEFLTLGKGVGTVVVPSAILGYRYQRPSGYVFRVSLTPFFPHGHVAAWAGASLGGAF